MEYYQEIPTRSEDKHTFSRARGPETCEQSCGPATPTDRLYKLASQYRLKALQLEDLAGSLPGKLPPLAAPALNDLITHDKL